jgi:hypothetical protein
MFGRRLSELGRCEGSGVRVGDYRGVVLIDVARPHLRNPEGFARSDARTNKGAALIGLTQEGVTATVKPVCCKHPRFCEVATGVDRYAKFATKNLVTATSRIEAERDASVTAT